MKNQTLFFPVLIIYIVLGFVSCKNQSSKEVTVKSEDEVISTFSIPGFYLNLVGDARDFKRLNSIKCQSTPTTPPGQRKGRKVGAVVLKYKISNQGLLLDGWQIIKRGNNDFGFSLNPNFSLEKAGESNVPYALDTYLSSIVMDNCFVQKIKQEIDRKPELPFVIFLPKANTGKPYIAYEVFLSNSSTGREENFNVNDFQGQKFNIFKIGELDDPIPPGGGGILDSNE